MSIRFVNLFTKTDWVTIRNRQICGISEILSTDSGYCNRCHGSVVCLSVCLSHSCTALKPWP